MDGKPNGNGKRVTIHIPISPELRKELWELAIQKYGTPYRKLHLIIEEALREYIEKHKGES